MKLFIQIVIFPYGMYLKYLFSALNFALIYTPNTYRDIMRRIHTETSRHREWRHIIKYFDQISWNNKTLNSSIIFKFPKNTSSFNWVKSYFALKINYYKNVYDGQNMSWRCLSSSSRAHITVYLKLNYFQNNHKYVSINLLNRS